MEVEKIVQEKWRLDGRNMIDSFWSKYLFETYVMCRKGPGWAQIFACHDEEDRDYFWILEDEVDAGRLVLPERKDEPTAFREQGE